MNSVTLDNVKINSDNSLTDNNAKIMELERLVKGDEE